MGKIISKVKHPFRNFNLEARAHKVVSQSKPKPAPIHLKDQMDVQRLKEEHPLLFEESLKKNERLDKYLRDVYVVANKAPIEVLNKSNPERPLPQDRAQPGPFLFGHKEPDRIPLGKITLRNALQFISQHQNEPAKFTSTKIAEEHKLPEDIVKNILKYFRVFEIYIPDQVIKTKAKFAGPSKPKVYIVKELRKALPEPEVKKEKDDT